MAEPAAPAAIEGVELGPLGQSPGFLLRLAQLDTFQDFFDAFEGQPVRPGEVTVLMLIGLNPGIRQGVLARALRIKRAHMAKMMRALEEAGLVARAVPPDDRRAVELRLTEAGERHLAQVRGPFARHEGRVVAPLTPRERAELVRLLRKSLSLSDESKTP
jgi:DNA-binding MarR family transcriptional regulator